jgi:hypothetical protein
VPADFAAKGARPLTAAERKQRQRLRDRLEREAASVTKGHETRVTGHASRDANVTEKRFHRKSLMRHGVTP